MLAWLRVSSRPPIPTIAFVASVMERVRLIKYRTLVQSHLIMEQRHEQNYNIYKFIENVVFKKSVSSKSIRRYKQVQLTREPENVLKCGHLPEAERLSNQTLEQIHFPCD